MTSNTAADFVVTPLTPAIGARVSGVDLARGMDNEAFAVIHRAFLEHLVLVFPGQNIPPAAQIAFTGRFGAVESHPLKARKGQGDHENLLVLENKAGQRGARNDFWHSDISCAPRPPALALLHAITVPEGKGDTLYCNMYRAWENLPGPMQRQLEGLTAEHSGEAIRQRNLAAETDGNRDITVPAPETHPVVRRHPETGRQTLFVNRFFTINFTGMTARESAPLLKRIEECATVPGNVYRHAWRAGDALLWDNRCTMHYAVYDYAADEPRHMHRTTAAGDRPAA